MYSHPNQPIAYVAPFRAFAALAPHPAGMGAFEVDFLDFNHDLYPRFRTEPGAHAAWLKGINDAAVEANISVQYCMALPSQMLNAVSLSAVTSARVSGDGGRPFTNGGPGQLLAAAVGIRPFKDNAWTVGDFPKGRADVIGSVITQGPVGLADQLNTTIAAVAAIACRRDGTLLSPNRPATPIDSTFTKLGQSAYSGMRFTTRGMAAGSDGGARGAETSTAGAAGGGGGMIMAAHYGPVPVPADPARPRWYVAVVADGASQSLAPDDLWPLPDASATHVWWQDTEVPGGSTAPNRCGVGAAASACLTLFSKMSPIPAAAAAKTVSLYHVAPVIGGWVCLGEVGKVVPVAAARVAEVVLTTSANVGGTASAPHTDDTAVGLSVTIVGSPGEAVEMLFAQPGVGTVVSKATVIPASGTAKLSVP